MMDRIIVIGCPWENRVTHPTPTYHAVECDSMAHAESLKTTMIRTGWQAWIIILKGNGRT